MRRRLFTLASLLSLLLCLATVVLWVRSYWVGDAIEVSLHDSTLGDDMEGDRYKTICIRSADGLFMAGRGFSYEQTFLHRNVRTWLERPPLIFRDDSRLWRRFGFLVDSGPDGLIYASFPFWVAFIGFGILPSVPIIRRLKRRSGTCATCHYDLTGNTSGICPECGTAVAGKAVA